MLKLQPIDTQERLYVRVARRIAELISSGEVKPGEKLPSERDLAEMLKVSRPSVREAMIALEVSGLIEVRTGSGIYVTKAAPGQSDSLPAIVADDGIGPFEILEMRLLIEPEACALAAERISPAQLAQLRAHYESMQNTNGTPEMETHDGAFHRLIAAATENTAIEKTVSWLWELRRQSELSRGFHRLIIEEGTYPVLDEHEQILLALEAKDADRARLAMRAHLEASTGAAASHFS